MLDEQLKIRYREELKRDRSKKSDSEFVRTTNLERELIDEHGFDAIRFIFENKNSANYFPLNQFPADCPWAHLNHLVISESIDTIFAPLATELPNLIEALKVRCNFLYAEKTNDTWKLHYFLDILLYDGRRYYEVYSGGAPNANPPINASLSKYQWTIPDDLKRFYALHDGFGPLLSSQEISIMAEMMDPICQKQKTYPEGYRFQDLLEFLPDGAGNAQCFHRQSDVLTTVDWDHEVRELSNERDFYEYLDERLSLLDEE